MAGFQNETFVFDPASNILRQDQTQAGYSPGHRLSFFGDRHFEYDDAGNLIKEKRGKGGQLVTEYRYDAQNQLVEVHKPGHQIVYQYDALGRRIAKADAFGETAFLWNGDVLLSETRRHWQKLYVYEPDSFRPLALVQNQRVYYYHLDHLGTPQELTDVEGQVVWNVRYRAYGSVVEKEVEQVENNLRFQGQYFDAETGLHYNRFRYYDPQIGQFVQPDPIGLLGGENVYWYVPNPTEWVDPFGLSEELPPDNMVVHRIGGGNADNLKLKPAEMGLDHPGISTLHGGTAQDAAEQMKKTFPKADNLHRLAEVVGTAKIGDIREAGFDVIYDPTRKFPNHMRIIHPRGAAGFNEDNLKKLSRAFQNTNCS